jgi:putative ABC transport system substrate-binding protein
MIRRIVTLISIDLLLGPRVAADAQQPRKLQRAGVSGQSDYVRYNRAHGLEKNYKLRLVVYALCAVLFAFCISAQAQQQLHIPKIGWLGARSFSVANNRQGSGAELFVAEFGKLGYVDGKNMTIEYRFADDKFDRLPALVNELVRLKVDLIIAAATMEAFAAKKGVRSIPIIFFNVPDPVASGLVDSLARPGGNITGFTTSSSLLSSKRLELLKEAIPNLSRVAVLWNPKNSASEEQWKGSLQASRELGLQLHSMEVSSVNQFDDAFQKALKGRSTAVAVTQETVLTSNLKTIMSLAARNELPVIYPHATSVESGGLMSYGPDRTEAYRRGAGMAHKILRGVKPADIPVEQPTKFELVINLKTAKQIGLAIPANVLARADRVIR